ncbi:MAG: Na+/H+ antiporter subunit E [Thiobacillaceae bacterium]
MNRLLALCLLFANFLKEAITSGWTTARIILRGDEDLQPGLVHMPYGELSDTAANFLGALVTLTPGTTTVDIDLARKEFLLHLLDARQAEATLASIQNDFLRHVQTLFGGRP